MRKYVIINASEVSTIDFSQVLNRNSDYVSYSVDGTKAFVKYEGDTPSFLEGKTTYDRSEMLTILANEEWSSPDGI